MPKIYGYTEILGDILITGSFSVLGSASTINTTNLVVSDTIISLGHSQSGTPTLDEGIMFGRGTGLTQAVIWDETNDTFAFIGTNDDHTKVGSININSYSNLRVGGLTTSTFKMSNGASTGYYLQSDALGNANWVSIPGGLTGSGTTNYLSKWSGSGTLANSLIFDNGSVVGINSWSSQNTLTIESSNELSSLTVGNTNTSTSLKRGIISTVSTKGSSTNNCGVYIITQDGSSINYSIYALTTGASGSINYGAYITNDSTATTNYGVYIDSRNATNNYGLVVNRGTSIFNNSSDAVSDFQIKGDTDNNLLYADVSADSIGVGTNTPSYKLQVSGTVSTTGFRMTNGSTTGYVLTSDATGNATWQATSNAVNIYSTTQSFSSGVTYSITHSLNTNNVVCNFWDDSTGELISVNVKRTSVNTINFNSTTTITSGRVVIMGG